jgi:hypothetical protein
LSWRHSAVGDILSRNILSHLEKRRFVARHFVGRRLAAVP